MNPADMTGGELVRRVRELEMAWGMAVRLYPPAMLAIMWEIARPEARAIDDELRLRGVSMAARWPLS